jgi:hypothetical protein
MIFSLLLPYVSASSGLVPVSGLSVSSMVPISSSAGLSVSLIAGIVAAVAVVLIIVAVVLFYRYRRSNVGQKFLHDFSGTSSFTIDGVTTETLFPPDHDLPGLTPDTTFDSMGQVGGTGSGTLSSGLWNTSDN